MGWGPSRVRDVWRVPSASLLLNSDLYPSQEFLFYHQKEYDLGDDPSSAATPWAQMIRWVPVLFRYPLRRIDLMDVLLSPYQSSCPCALTLFFQQHVPLTSLARSKRI